MPRLFVLALLPFWPVRCDGETTKVPAARAVRGDIASAQAETDTTERGKHEARDARHTRDARNERTDRQKQQDAEFKAALSELKGAAAAAKAELLAAQAAFTNARPPKVVSVASSSPTIAPASGASGA